jgi:hypothetical protein
MMKDNRAKGMLPLEALFFWGSEGITFKAFSK